MTRPPLNDEGHTQRRRYLIGELIVVLCLGVMPHLASSVIGVISPTSWGYPSWVGYVTGMAMSVQVIVPMMWIMSRSGTPMKEFGVVPMRMWRDAGLALGVCAWTMLAATLVHAGLVPLMSNKWAYEVFNVLPPSEIGRWASSPEGAWGLAMLMGYDFLNGFAEEIVIRGYLILRLTELIGGRWRAVVASSAIMASYHIYQGSFAMLELFLTEIAVGALWLKIPRLWAFAMGHGLYNLLLQWMYTN